MSKAWTYDEEQQLIDLRYEGIPYSEITEILGGTSTMLRKKHSRLMKEAFSPKWHKKIREHENAQGREGEI